MADVRLTLLSDASGPLPRVSRGSGGPRHRRDPGQGRAGRPGEPGARASPATPRCGSKSRALVYPGDQFIVRSVTPVTTIGGGRVIDPAPHKHSTGPRWHDRLTLLEQGPPDAIAALLLEEAVPAGPDPRETRSESLPVAVCSPPRSARPVAGLLADGRALAGEWRRIGDPAPAVDRPDSDRHRRGTPTGAAPRSECPAVPRPLAARIDRAALAALRAQAEKDALNPYLTLGELRRDLAGGKETPALDAALERLTGRQSGGAAPNTDTAGWAPGSGRSGPRGAVRSGAAVERVLRAVRGRAARMRPALAETPSVTVAAEAAGLPAREAQKIDRRPGAPGPLVKVGEDLYYPPDRLQALMDRLAAAMAEARPDDPGRSPRSAGHVAPLRPGVVGAHGLGGPHSTRRGGAALAPPPVGLAGAARRHGAGCGRASAGCKIVGPSLAPRGAAFGLVAGPVFKTGVGR